jgi:hypothetical protein
MDDIPELNNYQFCDIIIINFIFLTLVGVAGKIRLNPGIYAKKP